jgi:hypothetical protein
VRAGQGSGDRSQERSALSSADCSNPAGRRGPARSEPTRPARRRRSCGRAVPPVLLLCRAQRGSYGVLDLPPASPGPLGADRAPRPVARWPRDGHGLGAARPRRQGGGIPPVRSQDRSGAGPGDRARRLGTGSGRLREGGRLPAGAARSRGALRSPAARHVRGGAAFRREGFRAAPRACRPAATAAAPRYWSSPLSPTSVPTRPPAPSRCDPCGAPGEIGLTGLRVAGAPFAVRVGRLGLAMVEEVADALRLGA